MEGHKWLSIEDFQKEPNEGWCWVAYKGRVVEAYHDHEQRFRFHPHSQNCYLTECISWAMVWERPAMPNADLTGATAPKGDL